MPAPCTMIKASIENAKYHLKKGKQHFMDSRSIFISDASKVNGKIGFCSIVFRPNGTIGIKSRNAKNEDIYKNCEYLGIEESVKTAIREESYGIVYADSHIKDSRKRFAQIPLTFEKTSSIHKKKDLNKVVDGQSIISLLHYMADYYARQAAIKQRDLDIETNIKDLLYSSKLLTNIYSDISEKNAKLLQYIHYQCVEEYKLPKHFHSNRFATAFNKLRKKIIYATTAPHSVLSPEDVDLVFDEDNRTETASSSRTATHDLSSSTDESNEEKEVVGEQSEVTAENMIGKEVKDEHLFLTGALRKVSEIFKTEVGPVMRFLSGLI